MLTQIAADVVSIEKSGEHFRLLYDIKGRFAIHRITAEEATYKLLKVKKVQLGAKGVPLIVTHDGRTIRYPDPAIKVNDSVKFDLVENKCALLVREALDDVLTAQLSQDRRLCQVRGRKPCHGYWRTQHGTRGHDCPPRAPPRRLRHCPHS